MVHFNLRLIKLILISSLLPFQAASFHVILDPGHGGIDTGAVHGKAREAELVLKVANQLKLLLDKNADFKVTLTRTTDRIISLQDRVSLAEKHKGDIFVSLHANAAADQRAQGVEFFFQNYLPPDEESLFLASQENQNMMAAKEHAAISGEEELSKKGDIAAIIEDLHRQNRVRGSLRLTQTLNQVWNNEQKPRPSSIKQAPFYVISKTSMPSVLIEIGFLTNPREAKMLLNSDYQNGLAQKIYTALVTYKEKVDNSSAKTLN